MNICGIVPKALPIVPKALPLDYELLPKALPLGYERYATAPSGRLVVVAYIPKAHRLRIAST